MQCRRLCDIIVTDQCPVLTRRNSTCRADMSQFLDATPEYAKTGAAAGYTACH